MIVSRYCRKRLNSRPSLLSRTRGGSPYRTSGETANLDCQSSRSSAPAARSARMVSIAAKTSHSGLQSARLIRETSICSRSSWRVPFQILSARLTSKSSNVTSHDFHEAWVRANRANESGIPRLASSSVPACSCAEPGPSNSAGYEAFPMSCVAAPNKTSAAPKEDPRTRL